MNRITRYILLVALIISANILKSQTDIHPDYSRYMGKDYKWEPEGDGFIYPSDHVYTSFKSTLVDIYTKDNDFILRKYSDKSHRFKNEISLGGYDGYEPIIGKPVAFNLEGINYIATYAENDNGHFYLRLYSSNDKQMAIWSHTDKYHTYDAPQSKLKRYVAAYSYRGSVYLVYNKFYFYIDKLESDQDSYYGNYPDVFVDKCTIKDGVFEVDTTYYFENVLRLDKGGAVISPGNVSGFVHRKDGLCLLLSYHVENFHKSMTNHDNYNRGGGVSVLNLYRGSFIDLHKDSEFICDIDAIAGSMKGDKKTESEKNNTFRIQVVYNHFVKHDVLVWQNTVKYYYRTYTYDGAGYKLVRKGRILLHEDMIPKSTYKLPLALAEKYTTHDLGDHNRNNDYLDKTIWLFHPDKHGKVWGNVFHSDTWKPDPSTYAYSTDLMNDSLYGKTIRNLWTLVGITEGAPPVSVDWHKWDSLHVITTHPSTLTFSNTQSSETKITSATSYSYYNKYGFNYGKERDKWFVSGGGSVRWSQAFGSSEISSVTSSLKIEQEYYSAYETQESAYLIWSIPSVYRIQYAVYPWWDNDLTYMIDSSEVLRFYSLSSTLMVEKVKKKEKPFCINSPNNPSFSDWIKSKPQRDTILSIAGTYSIPPRGLSWTDGGPGTSNIFVNSKTNTTSSTHEGTFSIDANVNYNIPDVFILSVSGGIGWSWSDAESYSTTITKAVKISYEYLESKHAGSNVSQINVDAYYFTPMKNNDGSSVDWWYYKYFGNHQPWYITYVVNSVVPITINKPVSNGVVQKNTEISWKHDEKSEFEYTVLFSGSSLFGPQSYEISTANVKKLILTDQILERFPNDSIIYWVVKGKNSDNEYAWSKIHWMIIPKEKEYLVSEQIYDIKKLDFMVYPNPVSGSTINILIKSGLDSDEINMEVYSMMGKLIHSKRLSTFDMDGIELKTNIPELSTGFYIVKLSTEGAAGMVKIIVP